MAEQRREISDGTLSISVAGEGLDQVLSLGGELDLANAPTAEAELDAAIATAANLVVDMRRLEFIDSTGIALLVDVIGRNGDSARVSFVPSEFAAVTRVLELTGVAERMQAASG